VVAASPSRHRGTRIAVLACLGLAVLLGRAEASHAALSWTSAASGATATAQTCSSAFGPCYYINLRLHGNGSIVSTESENGMHVECPPANGFTCASDPWFNWADFTNPGMVEFTATPNSPAVFLGWGNQTTGDHGCPPDDPLNPDPEIAARVHQPAPNKCRVWLYDLGGMADGACLEATFSQGAQEFGDCGYLPGQPVGNPVVVHKNGTGSGTVTSNQPVTENSPPINCGTGIGCSGSFVIGEPVFLHATAAPGSVFAGWHGTVTCPGGSGTCSWSTVCPGTGQCSWFMLEGVTYAITATFNLTTPGPPPPPPPPLNTQLLKKPPKSTKSRTAVFYWVAKRGSTFVSSFKSQCRLDKAKSWTACRSGKSYRKLKPGAHTFRVRVGNAASGWDPTPAAYRWKIKAK
jgi:hypothetical protein